MRNRVSLSTLQCKLGKLGTFQHVSIRHSLSQTPSHLLWKIYLTPRLRQALDQIIYGQVSIFFQQLHGFVANILQDPSDEGSSAEDYKENFDLCTPEEKSI